MALHDTWYEGGGGTARGPRPGDTHTGTGTPYTGGATTLRAGGREGGRGGGGEGGTDGRPHVRQEKRDGREDGGGREKRGGRGGEKELRGYVLARIERWRVSKIARDESRELHRCGGEGGVFGIGRIRAQMSERCRRYSEMRRVSRTLWGRRRRDSPKFPSEYLEEVRAWFAGDAGGVRALGHAST